jgi:hypothetical protein
MIHGGDAAGPGPEYDDFNAVFCAHDLLHLVLDN